MRQCSQPERSECSLPVFQTSSTPFQNLASLVMKGECPGQQGAAEEIVGIRVAGDMLFYQIALNVLRVRRSNDTRSEHMSNILYKSSPGAGNQCFLS